MENKILKFCLKTLPVFTVYIGSLIMVAVFNDVIIKWSTAYLCSQDNQLSAMGMKAKIPKDIGYSCLMHSFVRGKRL